MSDNSDDYAGDDGYSDCDGYFDGYSYSHYIVYYDAHDYRNSYSGVQNS